LGEEVQGGFVWLVGFCFVFFFKQIKWSEWSKWCQSLRKGRGNTG